MALAACSSLSQQARLETGVDQYGPYTVVAVNEAGSDGLTAQANYGFDAVYRRIELRSYGSNKYATYWIVKSGAARVYVKGQLTFSEGFRPDGTVSSRSNPFNQNLPPWVTWQGNTGTLIGNATLQDFKCASVATSFNATYGDASESASSYSQTACAP